ARSSRERYRGFVQDYRQKRLGDSRHGDDKPPDGFPEEPDGASSPAARPSRRRKDARESRRWLWPHRCAVAAILVHALRCAGLAMIEPLLMRWIIDKVLLNTRLDSAAGMLHLNLAGALFVGVIVLSRMIGVVKDYRQRLVNVRVMLSLRESLFKRLLHLPLP